MYPFIVSQSTLTQLFPAEAKDKTIPTLPSKSIRNAEIEHCVCVCVCVCVYICGDTSKVYLLATDLLPVFILADHPTHNGFTVYESL